MGVVKFDNNVQEIGINYIESDYNAFLEDKKAGSISTFKNYRGDLNQFFNTVFGKEPRFVTVEDMESLTGGNIIQYRNSLRDKYSSNSTVNRKMNAVKSFFKYMESDHPNVRSAIFNKAKKLKEIDRRGWGILTYEEVVEMIRLSKTYDDGEELSLLVEVGFKTCIRLGALLSMTWENIYQKHEHGKDIWVIDVEDKSERHIKAISDDVYERLCTLRESDSNEEIIFKNFYDKKANSCIRSLCEQMDIDPRRNISFHSLKKAGINFVYESTGDIMMAQKQGNHKDASTTINSYMEFKEDLTAMPSYTMGEEIDLSPLNELSRDELVDLIGKCSATVKFELLRKIND